MSTVRPTEAPPSASALEAGARVLRSPIAEAEERHKCPSRCIACSSRRLKISGLDMDTFEQPHIRGWQCVACGRVWEGFKVGNAWQYRYVKTAPILLLPGELDSIVGEAYQRAGIKRKRDTV